LTKIGSEALAIFGGELFVKQVEAARTWLLLSLEARA
jgi:hypothetical protein